MALIAAVPAQIGGNTASVFCGCFSIRCKSTSGSVAPFFQSAEGMRPGLRWRVTQVPGFGRDWSGPNDKHIPMPVRAYPEPLPLDSPQNVKIRM